MTSKLIYNTTVKKSFFEVMCW